MRTWGLRSSVAFAVAVVLSYGGICFGSCSLTSDGSCLLPFDKWINHGGELTNRRRAMADCEINPSSASSLSLHWSFEASNMITSTPSFAGGIVYFSTWVDGNVYAIVAETGTLLWRQNLSAITGLRNAFTRATPTVAGYLLVVGIDVPAIVIILNRLDGSLVRISKLETNPCARITMSGSAYQGFFYVGTSSNEQDIPHGDCCTFQGSFIKVDLHSGMVLWRTLMLPYKNGSSERYSGAAVWGSSPAIDADRNLVYIATGNAYKKCEEAPCKKTKHGARDPSFAADNHANSIMALDMDTGKIKWATHLAAQQVRRTACSTRLHNPNCPRIPGPDYDFGEAPMLLTIPSQTGELDIVVAGQKSGVVWALDRDSGQIIWATKAGPGGKLGGASWGSAADDKRIYTNIINSQQLDFTLLPSTNLTKGGAWVALNATTGAVLWSTAVPGNAPAHGPVSVADGLVLVGGGGPEGGVYALDAETGTILWEAPTNGTVYGGFSVAQLCAFIGTGMDPAVACGNTETMGHTLYSFCVQ